MVAPAADVSLLLTKLKLTAEVAVQVWDLGAGGEEVRRIVKE